MVIGAGILRLWTQHKRYIRVFSMFKHCYHCHGDTDVKFTVPDPKRFRISECGHYIIEKFNTTEGDFYAVWQFERVLHGMTSAQAAVDAIKNREADHLQKEAEYWNPAHQPRYPVSPQNDSATHGPASDPLESLPAEPNQTGAG